LEKDEQANFYEENQDRRRARWDLLLICLL